MNKKDTHILLFDGVCNLCNSIVQFVIKKDIKEKFQFASLQSVSGQALLQKFGLPTDDFNSFVYIHGDQYFLKSSAAIQVLVALGGLWKLLYIFTIFPRPVRDFVYSVFAKRRYKIFGKRDTCMVATPGLKRRFLQ